MEKQQTSNEYGISQELLILSFLVNYGPVSIPYGNSARYDCVLDFNNQFIRIQIKSLNKINEDTVVIPMSNTRMSANGHVKKIYTQKDVDYIAVYFNGWVYLFTPELATKAFTVRINKPLKSNQHWIEDYRIDKILNITIKSWTSLKEETRITNNSYQERKYNCIDCGAPVWNPNSRCISCERIHRLSKSTKPSREILKEKIKNTPFTTIGTEYGVSDNAVRKWCKSYDLPYKTKEIKEILKKGEWDLV